jgi:hypothetical protein
VKVSKGEVEREGGEGERGEMERGREKIKEKVLQRLSVID